MTVTVSPPAHRVRRHQALSAVCADAALMRSPRLSPSRLLTRLDRSGKTTGTGVHIDLGADSDVVGPVLKVSWHGHAVSVDRRFETWFDVTHRHRRGVSRFGWTASRVGDVGPVLVCGWLLVSNRRRGLAASAVIAGQALVVNLGVKRIFQRARPDDGHEMTSSLPSGHVATAVCAALLAPGGGVRAMAAAGSVCAAGRIAKQRHWVSDTIAGALVGAGVGYAFKRTLGNIVLAAT